MILSKSDGSIIQSSGLIRDSSGFPASSPPPASEPPDDISKGSAYNRSRALDPSQEGSETADKSRQGNTAEDIAKMVFSFVMAARDFAEGMDTADEVKLLRMRTRKNEIVIVPGKPCCVFMLLAL